MQEAVGETPGDEQGAQGPGGIGPAGPRAPPGRGAGPGQQEQEGGQEGDQVAVAEDGDGALQEDGQGHGQHQPGEQEGYRVGLAGQVIGTTDRAEARGPRAERRPGGAGGAGGGAPGGAR